MSESYEMMSNPHGTCLIFDNHFDGTKRRKGIKKDCLKLKDLFKMLKYKVRTEENKNASEMLSILNEINMDEKNKDYDSFVCCILSHGVEAGIRGNDYESILYYREIWSLFGEKQSHLKHKPKIFLVQACQAQITQNLNNQSCGSLETVSSDSSYTDDNDINMDDAAPSTYGGQFNQSYGTLHEDMIFIFASVPGKICDFTVLTQIKKVSIF